MFRVFLLFFNLKNGHIWTWKIKSSKYIFPRKIQVLSKKASLIIDKVDLRITDNLCPYFAFIL